MSVYKFQKNCRLCNSSNFKLILDLGKQPPSNALLTKKQVKVKEKKFPLRLYICKKCFHLQLRDVVDKKLLFSNYFYTTGANQTMVKHFHDYSEYLFKKFLRKTTGGIFSFWVIFCSQLSYTVFRWRKRIIHIFR